MSDIFAFYAMVGGLWLMIAGGLFVLARGEYPARTWLARLVLVAPIWPLIAVAALCYGALVGIAAVIEEAIG